MTTATSETDVLLAKANALEIAKAAEEITVVTGDDYRAAGEFLTRIKGAMKKLEETRKALVKPLDDEKRAIQAAFALPKDNLASAEAGIKRKLLAYDAEQERKAREAEARLRAQAEEEARRLEEERKRALDAAIESGDTDKAEAIISAPEPEPVVQAVVPRMVAPKVAGVSSRNIWTWRITDKEKIPREYLLVNESALTSLARSAKGAVKVPGVEFYQVSTIAARG